MAPAVLAHRVIQQPDAELQGRTGAELVGRAMQSVPVPRAAPAR
jgi:MoxR-like ATPase